MSKTIQTESTLDKAVRERMAAIGLNPDGSPLAGATVAQAAPVADPGAIAQAKVKAAQALPASFAAFGVNVPLTETKGQKGRAFKVLVTVNGQPCRFNGYLMPY